MKVYTPGKLILSGEHAVVYGNPALAIAVNRYASATIKRQMLPHVSFDLADLAYKARLSLDSLHDLKKRIKKKYDKFVRGDVGIRQVLQQPVELAQFALSVLTEALNVRLPHGVNVRVQSDIPVGCGMGSSAAIVLSVMYAMSQYLEQPLSEETLYQLALNAENMQHGRSSGLDLRVALRGGGLYVHGDKLESRLLPTQAFYLVNTGVPDTTTGQCVEAVAPHFKDSNVVNDFAAVTALMDEGLRQQNIITMQEAVRHNHQLLKHIGVVPARVQTFIESIEAAGGAAKTCGAGAIAGDKGGIVLVMMEQEAELTALCQSHDYVLETMTGVNRGIYAD